MIVRDRDGLLLMFEGVDPTTPEVRFWFTPGGGLDAGETFEEAAARELREEAGYELRVLGGVVHEDEVEFDFEGVTYRQRQRFFAVAVPVAGPTAAILTAPSARRSSSLGVHLAAAALARTFHHRVPLVESRRTGDDV